MQVLFGMSERPKPKLLRVDTVNVTRDTQGPSKEDRREVKSGQELDKELAARTTSGSKFNVVSK